MCAYMRVGRLFDNRIHVGNARPLVVFDVLVRLLRAVFANVTYVRNITDVDDKINARAAERGISIAELCEQTIIAFMRIATPWLFCLRIKNPGRQIISLR